MVDRLEEAARGEVRIGEQHQRREHGRGADAGALQLLGGLVRLARAHPRSDDRVDLRLGGAPPGGSLPRLVAEPSVADDLAERVPGGFGIDGDG